MGATMATKVGGYSSKKFKWDIPSATPSSDAHNAPRGEKHQSAWQKEVKSGAKAAAPYSSSAAKPSASVSSRTAAYSGGSSASSSRAPNPPKPSTPAYNATAAALDRDAQRIADQENERRRQQASASSSVSGNADWVKDAKNAQERADMVAAQRWMEAVTGKRFVNGDLWETTKSGVYLCDLINKIAPGTCSRYKESKMPFTCMENITKYIEGCKKLGMRGGQTFRPPDLYEKRVSYPRAIVNNIHGLAKIADDRGYRGPKLDVEIIAGNKC